MASYTGGSGCTILVWVNDDSWRLKEVPLPERDNKRKELLEDAIVLLTGRWNMDSSITELNGVLYGHLVCPRFTIGVQTIIRALGDLSDSIFVHRGSSSDSAVALIKYIECKRKYAVPDVVSEGTSGEYNQESGSLTPWAKRQRK